MLPRAVAEGRRIARNIHRLGRLYLTKTVYAGFLIVAAALFGFAFPFLPRQLTVAAMLTIGIPSFVLALAPSEGPLYRGRLLRRSPRSRSPPGSASASARCSRSSSSTRVFGGTLDEGRTAATTTLIVLGLAFILLLERGPGREHIAIQSYMLAMVAGARRALRADPRVAPVRDFFELELLSAGQWFLSLLSVAGGLGGRRARSGACPTSSGSRMPGGRPAGPGDAAAGEPMPAADPRHPPRASPARRRGCARERRTERRALIATTAAPRSSPRSAPPPALPR